MNLALKIATYELIRAFANRLLTVGLRAYWKAEEREGWNR